MNYSPVVDCKSIKIKYLTDSFLNLVDLVNLDEVDLVMASAVFDLISFSQFVDFGSVLLEKRLPLFTTLNYAEMNFNSDSPSDVVFIEKYESFMNRPQEFGKAMGKKCPRILVDFFQKQEAKIKYGPSIWKLEGESAQVMNHHLLNFMESASRHIMENEDEKLFKDWITSKREAVEEIVSPLGGPLKMSLGVEDLELKIGEDDMSLNVRFGFAQMQITDQDTDEIG